MGTISSIVPGLPLCGHTKKEQTKLSLGLRVTAISLGLIAMTVGVLILCCMPGLSQFGTTTGWILFPFGVCFLSLGTIIKCVKLSKPPNYIQNSEKQKDRTKFKDSKDTSEHIAKSKSKSPETPIIESVRKEVLDWLNQDGNVLGEGQYGLVIAPIKQIANQLTHDKITLHYQQHKSGFSFFYAEKRGEKKYIPIVWEDGVIMRWQANNEGDSVWPILDAEKNIYIVPKITVMDTPIESKTVRAYILGLLQTAKSQKNSNAYLILEALTSYAESFAYEIGEDSYKELRGLIRTYPERSFPSKGSDAGSNVPFRDMYQKTGASTNPKVIPKVLNSISVQDSIKIKEFSYYDCFSIKAVLWPEKAIHRKNQFKYAKNFASIQEKFLKLLKLNDISALEKRFQELYNDKEMDTDIVFFTKAKQEVWLDEYVIETLWLFYCKDEELFDLPLTVLITYDTNQKTVLSLRIKLTQRLREEQWRQNWASSPPKEESIGSLFASNPEAFRLKNLFHE